MAGTAERIIRADELSRYLQTAVRYVTRQGFTADMVRLDVEAALKPVSELPVPELATKGINDMRAKF